MRKAYIAMAVGTFMLIWVLLALLLNWWLAALIVLLVVWLFYKEVTPILRYWRPQRRTGWQRNALRWERREMSDSNGNASANTAEWRTPHRD